MRTTLDIDDDVLQAVKERAAAENKTAGKVLSDLARHGLAARQVGVGPLIEKNGWLVRPSRGVIITNDLIRSIEEEMDRDDAGSLGRELPARADG